MKLENLERAEKLRKELKWVTDNIKNIELKQDLIDIDLIDPCSGTKETLYRVYTPRKEFAKKFIVEVIKDLERQREDIIKEIETL